MSISDTTRSQFLSLVLFAGAAVGAGGARAASEETYDWSAQLVSFDAATGTAVLKERVEAHADIVGLDGFADGDRLTLVWTGRSWAAGIRDLARDPELPEWALRLPVEFVASEGDGEYIHFRIKVPASAVEMLAGLDPGVRLRGESPRTGANFDAAVVSLRHYNDVN
jgi:hypothetical protein